MNMTYEEVKAIVAEPALYPDELIVRALAKPQYLEDWLREKGKAFAGYSRDCQGCVVAAYLQEKLTSKDWEFEYLEVTNDQVEVNGEDWAYEVDLPEWTKRFIQKLDAHRNNSCPLPSGKKARIFSGNLAANILKISLQENQA